MYNIYTYTIIVLTSPKESFSINSCHLYFSIKGQDGSRQSGRVTFPNSAKSVSTVLSGTSKPIFHLFY